MRDDLARARGHGVAARGPGCLDLVHGSADTGVWASVHEHRQVD